MEFKDFLNEENQDKALKSVSLKQLQDWEKSYPLFKALSLLVMKKKKNVGQAVRDEQFEQRAWNLAHRAQLVNLIFERPEKNVVVKEAIAPVVESQKAAAESVKQELTEMREAKTELLRPFIPMDADALKRNRLEVDRDLQKAKEDNGDYDEDEIRGNIQRALDSETQKLSSDAKALREELSNLPAKSGEQAEGFKKISADSVEMKSLKDKIKQYEKSKHFKERKKEKEDLAIASRMNPILSKEENITLIRQFISDYAKKGFDIEDRQRTIDEMVAKSIDSESIPVSEALAQLFAEQGYPHKAVEVYRSLGLIYPDKISYFAKRIVNLNNP